MAKNKNTFEKRRREMARMEKAQKKRARRHARKASPEDIIGSEMVPPPMRPAEPDPETAPPPAE